MSSTLVTLPNVSPQGYWESSLDSVSVNGVDLGLKDRTTVFDTGGFFHMLIASSILNGKIRHDTDDAP